ncbi:MAG: hypothetical protein HQK53_09455, partial [Oligoflexia bacterium]|nr:hypothetical protein [Oligoflexia bacterium]
RRGYDSVSGDTRGYCVQRQETQKISTGLASITAELKYIEDYKSLAESLDLSAATNLKIGILGVGVSLGATAKYFSEQKLENNSIYLMIKIVVRSPIETMEDVLLSENYVSMLKGEGGTEEFRKRCGDEYVVSIQKGGYFYSLLQLHTKNEEEKQNLSVSIKAKVGRFDTAAAMNRVVQEVAQGKEVSIFIHQEGGIMNDIPFSLDEAGLTNLFTHAREFAKDIMDPNKGNGGTPVISITEPYTNLANYPTGVSPLRIALKQNIVQRLSENRFEALKLIDRLEYIINNQTHYITDGSKLVELNQARDSCVSNLDIIAELADECFYDITKCRLPTANDGFKLVKIPEVKKQIDDRKCIEWLYKEAEGEICGVEKYFSKRDHLCGVEQYSLGTGATCGVQSYKFARTAGCGIDPSSKRSSPFISVSAIEGEIKNPNVNYPDRSLNGVLTWQCRTYHKFDVATEITRGTNRVGLSNFDGYYFSCANYFACEHPSNGVASYKTCRDEQFGVDRYKDCSLQSFGVERYKRCRDKSFGIERCLKLASEDGRL